MASGNLSRENSRSAVDAERQNTAERNARALLGVKDIASGVVRKTPKMVKIERTKVTDLRQSHTRKIIMTYRGMIAGRAERRAQREQERAARVQALEAQLADEFQRPGRVIVTVASGTNPANPPTAMNVVVPEPHRVRPGNVPAAFGNWTFSPLTLRRPRAARAEDGAAPIPDAANTANGVTIRWRPRENGVPPTPLRDIELPSDVRRELSIQPNVQSDGVQVALSTDGGSPGPESGADGDDPMIIG